MKGDAVLCKCSYLIIAPIFNVRNSNCNIIKIIHVLLTEMRRTNTKNTIIIMHGNEDTLSEFSELFFFLRTSLSKLNKCLLLLVLEFRKKCEYIVF